MTVRDEVTVAKIKEREQAQREFVAAKEQGKSASLLTQERPNVFTMNVANVLPGDEIRVELTYNELLVPTDGVYAFVYPTAIGPRYSSSAYAFNGPLDHFIATPYLDAHEPRRDAFTLTATIESGIPIAAVRSTTHPVSTRFQSPSSVRVALDPRDETPANRDFVLEYALAQDQIASGLMTYSVGDESYFLLMAEPPKRVEPKMIVPREYIFVLDVSGSMYGFPLNTAKEVMRGLLGELRANERFNVILFSGRAAVLYSQSVEASEPAIDAAMQLIDDQVGGGGTELAAALQKAFDLPKSQDMSRSVVVVTDGFIAEERYAFDLVRSHLHEANVFSFGIGSSVNRHLIEGVAHAGLGEPFIVTKPEDAPAAASRFRNYISSPLLTGLSLRGEGLELYDVEPKTIPDVFASRPVVVTGKFKGSGVFKLVGVNFERSFASETAVTGSSALRQLWARSRLVSLADMGGEREERDAITKLGLTYNLLTKYTSFIAVHEQVRTSEAGFDVEQPQVMPQGMEASPMTEGTEPELFIVGLLLALIVFFAPKRQVAE
jgi:Ca-activated chloride channel family protein